MIGESAVITAQIKAASIIVAGKVSGDITATQRIEIRPSAKVIGNLTAPVLVVHEGALFEGHCSMQPEACAERTQGHGFSQGRARRGAAGASEPAPDQRQKSVLILGPTAQYGVRQLDMFTARRLEP